MARVVIVDQNILFREGLVNLLKHETAMTVVGEASSIREAAEKFKDQEPNLFLLDADLPFLKEHDGIHLLLTKYPIAQVVVLCASNCEERMIDAVRSGARGYLPKQISVSRLVTALSALDRGEAVIPRGMVGRLLDEISRNRRPINNEELRVLTPRETDVLREIGNGRTNRQIADHLAIAENTVKVHVHNILDKLNLRNRRQAAAFARKQGISSNNTFTSKSGPSISKSSDRTYSARSTDIGKNGGVSTLSATKSPFR